LVKEETDIRIKKKIDDTVNQQRNLFYNYTSKDENVNSSSILEKNFTANTKSSQPPPLPSRKNLGLSTHSEIKIPRRPPQHTNPFNGVYYLKI
jgi:hypothetical protein